VAARTARQPRLPTLGDQRIATLKAATGSGPPRGGSTAELFSGELGTVNPILGVAVEYDLGVYFITGALGSVSSWPTVHYRMTGRRAAPDGMTDERSRANEEGSTSQRVDPPPLIRKVSASGPCVASGLDSSPSLSASEGHSRGHSANYQRAAACAIARRRLARSKGTTSAPVVPSAGKPCLYPRSAGDA
jgi:hypothetical protein